MAVIGVHLIPAGFPPALPRRTKSSAVESRLKPPALVSARRFSLSSAASGSKPSSACGSPLGSDPEEDEEQSAKSLKDYFEEAKEFIRSDGGGGPPRWFSPLECGACSQNSPLLLFLPGIFGVGLGLIRQHQQLGKKFDIWCLHIPARDRTLFKDLVNMIERTVRSENHRLPNRPIYLIGESLGACIALAVAASIPDLDLVLILANPGTSFGNSPLQTLASMAKIFPDQLHLTVSYMLSLMTGAPLKNLIGHWVKGLPIRQTLGRLYQDIVRTSTYNAVLANLIRRETLVWKLQLLDAASTSANEHLHLVKAQTLVLSSGRDQLLSSQTEAKRLRQILPKCEIRNFKDRGHFLFLYSNCVSDYTPMTISEFNKCYGLNRLFEILTGSVFLSTKEDGEIVRGLGGIPSEGPVLVVGNHMLVASDVVSVPGQFFAERNIILRGIAHPFMFRRLRDGWLPDLSMFDTLRMMGIVPVSGNNLHNLLSSKSHVLLYPGGIREALHRKGEEYKLMWPENPEFVRMSAKFGAKIIPFGVVGEDDVFREFLDYNDQIKIPYVKSFIESLTNEAEILRTVSDEEGNQALHFPGIFPKFPGRFYFYFGKPIETKGREEILSDREKSQELYQEVKSEVERCLAFLKDKREHDPYRGLLPRLKFQIAHGFGSEVPTFEF